MNTNKLCGWILPLLLCLFSCSLDQDNDMPSELEDCPTNQLVDTFQFAFSSVLVDDARTPLIISGPIPKGDEHEFYDLKPRIAKLVDAQKKLVSQYLIDAKKLIASGDEKDGGLALFRSYRGLPKHKPLIKYLSDQGHLVL